MENPTSPTNRKALFKRLSTDVVPNNYRLRLQPFLDDGKFSGELIITVDVCQATNRITLDACDITINSAYFVSSDAEPVSSEIEYESATISRVIIKFPRVLTPTKNAQLRISYDGLLGERMQGLYRNRYWSADGTEQKWGACTHFEACHARYCLPCWDDPSVKATFDCTLVVPRHLDALSNMPVKSESTLETDATWKVIEYEQTPKMSTYLLAFCIGEYDFVEGKTSSGTLVRVYTPTGKAAQGQFSLEFSQKTLPYYERFFEIGFPLPKVDLIALENFAIGAMENWGLLTFRETALLIDSEKSSSAQRQDVAAVVGHELAHMWFGNLVTMKWWTDLWLKEGFAVFVEHLAVDHAYPEWKIWEQFVNDIVNSAMQFDSLAATHPIEVPVGHPDDVEEIFDRISYLKGASIIRMVYHFVGDECFRRGLAAYLKEFQYGNAETLDLWRHLETASGQPVRTVMSDWTRHPGYPYLAVELEEGGNTLHLTQKRFSYIPSTSRTLWNIPLTARIYDDDGDETPREVKKLIEQSEVSTLEICRPAAAGGAKSPSDSPIIVVNPRRVGFYRVHYSDELLQRLVPAVRDGRVEALDRLSLQNDQFELCQAGVASLTTYLDLIRTAYCAENDPIVWEGVILNLVAIQSLLRNAKHDTALTSGAYDAFLRDALQPIARELGWHKTCSDEPHLRSMLREQVLWRMIRAGNGEYVGKAYKMLEEYVAGRTAAIEPELRHPVFNSATHFGAAGYELLRAVFDKSDMQEERVRALVHIGAINDAKVLRERALEWAVSDSGPRAQDLPYLLMSCASRPENRDVAWLWLQHNWERVKALLPSNLLYKAVSRLVGAHTEESVIAPIRQFFKQHPLDSGQRQLEQAIESIRIQSALLQRDEVKVQYWLAQHQYAAAPASALKTPSASGNGQLVGEVEHVH